MDWSNEAYVKVYTRETDDDLALSWEARAVWDAALKKFDRSGVIATKRGARGLAALVRIPIEVVERAIPELLTDGRLVERDDCFIAPNYIEAQEASKSDKLRQKESRERRRSGVTFRDAPVTNRDVIDPAVTKRDQPSQIVTDRHERSHDVTLCSALHSVADPEQSALPRVESALPELPDPGAAVRLERVQAAAPAPAPLRSAAVPSATPNGSPERVRFTHDAWELGRLAHQKLRERGIDASAVPWPPMIGGAAGSDLNALVRELLAGDPPDLASARVTIERRIAVAVAEAEREGHLRWFAPTRIWDPKSFWRAAETTPEHVRTRAGPRAATPTRPAAPPRTGRPLPNLADLPEER